MMPIVWFSILVIAYHMMAHALYVLAKNIQVDKGAIAWIDAFFTQHYLAIIVANNFCVKIIH